MVSQVEFTARAILPRVCDLTFSKTRVAFLDKKKKKKKEKKKNKIAGVAAHLGLAV